MNKKPELTKEFILSFMDDLIRKYEMMAHTSPFVDRDLRTLKAIRFVLKNRTVENWGPKEMSFGEAMGEVMNGEYP